MRGTEKSWGRGTINRIYYIKKSVFKKKKKIKQYDTTYLCPNHVTEWVYPWDNIKLGEKHSKILGTLYLLTTAVFFFFFKKILKCLVSFLSQRIFFLKETTTLELSGNREKVFV